MTQRPDSQRPDQRADDKYRRHGTPAIEAEIIASMTLCAENAGGEPFEPELMGNYSPNSRKWRRLASSGGKFAYSFNWAPPRPRTSVEGTTGQEVHPPGSGHSGGSRSAPSTR